MSRAPKRISESTESQLPIVSTCSISAICFLLPPTLPTFPSMWKPHSHPTAAPPRYMMKSGHVLLPLMVYLIVSVGLCALANENDSATFLYRTSKQIEIGAFFGTVLIFGKLQLICKKHVYMITTLYILKVCFRCELSSICPKNKLPPLNN